MTDPSNLRLEPGRIALVGFELSGPDACGGIGTALGALAEALRAAGHEVHLLYCPFNGAPTLRGGWIEYWRARGVTLHYLPRRGRMPLAWPSFRDFAATVGDLLQALDVDLVHGVDADAYAAVAALRRATAQGFAYTQIITAMHGCASWHRRGNGLRQTWDEAEHMNGLEHLLRHGDVVCYPSEYMRDWAEQHLPPALGATVVMPNCLPSATRASETVARRVRTVDEIVFFGRLERRKGLESFARVVRELAADRRRRLTVTLLGKPGEGVGRRDLEVLFAGMECEVRYLTTYGNVEAVEYLKARACVAVVASTHDNSPYTVYECLENGIPLLTSAVGGIPELVHADDRARTLVADTPAAMTQALAHALVAGIRPARLAFDPARAEVEQLSVHAKLVDTARRRRSAGLAYASATSSIRSATAFLAEPGVWKRTAHAARRVVHGAVGRGRDALDRRRRSR